MNVKKALEILSRIYLTKHCSRTAFISIDQQNSRLIPMIHINQKCVKVIWNAEELQYESPFSGSHINTVEEKTNTRNKYNLNQRDHGLAWKFEFQMYMNLSTFLSLKNSLLTFLTFLSSWALFSYKQLFQNKNVKPETISN